MAASDQRDVIVVGGGTAGCILASRLSEDQQRSVLLLEAGPDYDGVDAYPPTVLDEHAYPVDFTWRFVGLRTEADDPPIEVVRGRVIGGSGSVNTMWYQRGAPEDYDSWGSPLWSSAALEPFFRLIERDVDVRDETRGRHGIVPLRRTPRAEWSPSQRAFERAVIELGAREIDLLHNVEDGVGAVPRNCEHGVRVSASIAYLQAARGRSNLEVRGGAHVARVTFDRGCATGVELIDGETIPAHEVVLSAGTIGSPQLLTLSGVGPREVLDRLGIATVAECPGVGRNLSDHPNVGVVAELAPDLDPGDTRVVTVAVRTASDSSTPQDMALTLVSGDFAGTGRIDARIVCVLLLPDSVGEVEVVSADPTTGPRIHYRYLESARDRARLREAVRHAVRIFEAPAFAPLGARVVAPTATDLSSDQGLDGWVRRNGGTALHGAGTCRMGPASDPMAVVAEDGRVHRVRGLRVVDLSIAPRVVRSATNATAMVIGERVAALMQG